MHLSLPNAQVLQASRNREHSNPDQYQSVLVLVGDVEITKSEKQAHKFETETTHWYVIHVPLDIQSLL